MRTRLLGYPVGAVTMASLTLAGAPAAHAAAAATARTAPQAAVVSVPVGENSATLITDGATVTVVRSASSPAVVLTCSVTPQKPTHGTAGVSSVVTATCNTTAATVSFGAALYYDGDSVAQNNSQVHNCIRCSVTVTAPYATGQWKAGALIGYFDSQGDGQFTDEVYTTTVKL